MAGSLPRSAVRGVETVVADPARTLRAATFGFLRGLRPEATTFEITEIRTGRALATYHLAISQGGGPPSVVGRCHLSPTWDGASFSDLQPLDPNPPADAVRLTDPAATAVVTSTTCRPGCTPRPRCSPAHRRRCGSPGPVPPRRTWSTAHG